MIVSIYVKQPMMQEKNELKLEIESEESRSALRRRENAADI